MFIKFWISSFAKIITNMTDTYKEEIADVSRKENIIWRVLFVRRSQRDTDGVSRLVPVGLVITVTKFGVHSVENLSGRWWHERTNQTIISSIIVVMSGQNGRLGPITAAIR